MVYENSKVSVVMRKNSEIEQKKKTKKTSVFKTLKKNVNPADSDMFHLNDKWDWSCL